MSCGGPSHSQPALFRPTFPRKCVCMGNVCAYIHEDGWVIEFSGRRGFIIHGLIGFVAI